MGMFFSSSNSVFCIITITKKQKRHTCSSRSEWRMAVRMDFATTATTIIIAKAIQYRQLQTQKIKTFTLFNLNNNIYSYSEGTCFMNCILHRSCMQCVVVLYCFCSVSSSFLFIFLFQFIFHFISFILLLLFFGMRVQFKDLL